MLSVETQQIVSLGYMSSSSLNDRTKRIEAISAAAKTAEAARRNFRDRPREFFKKRDAEWQRLLDHYQRTTQNATPKDWPELLQLIESHSQSAIEYAVDYLLADPLFNESGYIKAAIIRVLKRQHIAQADREALLTHILKKTDGTFPAGSFKDYARLAAALQNEQFIRVVSVLAKSEATDISNKANWLLVVCQSKR
jgi:hypothetical protein